MFKVNKALISLALLSVSASSFAYSVKTIDCFEQSEMTKKRSKRISSFSLISAKIGKDYKYAIYNSKSLQADDVVLDSGVYELAQSDKRNYISYLADKTTQVSLTTTVDNFYAIKDIRLEISKENQNTSFDQSFSCLANSSANKMGPAYLRSYKKHFNQKNTDFLEIINDTLYLADVYNDKKKELDLKKGKYLSLKNNNFKLSSAKANVLDDGDIIIEDDKVGYVACRVKTSSSRSSKVSKNGDVVAKVECLKPNFKVKRRSTRKKLKWNFNFSSTDTTPILQCESPKRSKRVKRVKVKKSKFHKRKLPRRATRRVRTSKPRKG